MRNSLFLPAAALLVGLAACEADREAVEDAPLDKNEAIEAAPANPIPPIGVPVGNEPVSGDTTMMDTMSTGAGTPP